MLKILFLMWVFRCISAEVLEANSFNIAEIINKKNIVLLNFYAGWCRYSKMLEPIYEQLATEVQKSDMNDKVAIARIDGSVNQKILMQYKVEHFPAILIFRKGQFNNREYHGSRDLNSMLTFVKEIAATKPVLITHISQMDKKSEFKVHIKVPSKNTPEYALFEKVAEKHIDNAKFYVMEIPGKPEITFYTSMPYDKVETFDSNKLHDEAALDAWIHRISHPVVREITFENADTIIGDQVPLVVLFYKEEAKSQLPVYVNKLEQLKDHFSGYNLVVANAQKFNHALRHVQRTSDDVPFIALDDFRHIFYFGKFEELNDLPKLKKFIDEHRSGELHRRLHQEMQIEIIIIDSDKKNAIGNQVLDKKPEQHKEEEPIYRPKKDVPATSKKPSFVKSLFQKLLPDQDSFSHVNEVNEL